MFFAFIEYTDSYGVRHNIRQGRSTMSMDQAIAKVIKKGHGYVTDEHLRVVASVNKGKVSKPSELGTLL